MSFSHNIIGNILDKDVKIYYEKLHFDRYSKNDAVSDALGRGAVNVQKIQQARQQFIAPKTVQASASLPGPRIANVQVAPILQQSTAVQSKTPDAHIGGPRGGRTHSNAITGNDVRMPPQVQANKPEYSKQIIQTMQNAGSNAAQKWQGFTSNVRERVANFAYGKKQDDAKMNIPFKQRTLSRYEAEKIYGNNLKI